MNTEPKFLTRIDETGLPYFSVNLASVLKGQIPPNVSESTDIATFLSDTLTVTPRATGLFSSDLTSSDDPLLALLSLLLLLVIESILATVLLKTYKGHMSNSAFSVKQFLDLARDFRIRHLLKGNTKRSSSENKPRINRNLLIVAISVLVISFGLEGTILFLSSPELVQVTNDITSYTLLDAVMPDWDQIRKDYISTTVRPCSAITVIGVDQGDNQLSLCMSSDRKSTTPDVFLLNHQNINVTIISDVHEFGVEHQVSIANDSAKFTARVYFTLGDGRNRLLRQRQAFFRKEMQFALIHKQLIAYLFTYYFRETQDPRMNLQNLEALKFNFSTQTSTQPLSVIKVLNKDRFRQVVPTTHSTTVTGRIPAGTEALRFAHATLKGAIAVSLTGPDENDLNMGTGDTRSQNAWLWKESSRKLNWLSLTILLVSSSLILLILRVYLTPIATAEIAGTYVSRMVGAEVARPPALLQKDEKKSFRIPV